MKTRKYKKYGGEEKKKEEETDERTEQELIVVDLAETFTYNANKYKHFFDLNNFTNGCPDKLLKIIFGEMRDEDENKEQEKEKKKKKKTQMNTKAKEITEKFTGKGASDAQELAINPEIAGLAANMLKDKGKQVLENKMGANPQAKAAAEKALSTGLLMASELPAVKIATVAAEKAIGKQNFENAKKEAKRMAEEKAKKLKEQVIEKAGGGRKNRKKTRKKRFRKKKKSP